MIDIVCEDCHHEQRIVAFDVEPSCERCGSKNLTQADAVGAA